MGGVGGAGHTPGGKKCGWGTGSEAGCLVRLWGAQGQCVEVSHPLLMGLEFIRWSVWDLRDVQDTATKVRFL